MTQIWTSTCECFLPALAALIIWLIVLYSYRQFRYEVGKFLLNAGYKFKPSDFGDEPQDEDFEVAVRDSHLALDTGLYPMKGVGTILTFVKLGLNGKELKVQMIVAGRSCRCKSCYRSLGC